MFTTLRGQRPEPVGARTDPPGRTRGKPVWARLSAPGAPREDGRVLVVSVLSLKGGVGKTSVVLGLAGAATVRGLATLVIDLDPQGNATSLLAAQPGKAGAAEVLANPTRTTVEAALTPCDWEVAPGEVDVLPSHPNLIRFDAWTGRTVLQPKLARARQFFAGYDLVLIDCPPSLGALAREALAASDLALVVTTPSFFGAQGVERAVAEIDEIRKTVNRGLRLAGIVINRVRSVAEEHAYRTHELADIYGRVSILTPLIPERIAVQQAEGTGQPIQLIKSEGGREVAAVYDIYLDRLLAGEA